MTIRQHQEPQPFSKGAFGALDGCQVRSGVPADGFPAGQVSHVDKGVIEGGEDVGHAKDKLSFSHLGEKFVDFTLNCLNNDQN
jgi:hypothetical protein